MKKGFFLLASLAAIFTGKTSNNGINFGSANKVLENCNQISGGGGKPSKRVWDIMDKKRRHRNKKNRLAKISRNINHKKAA